MDRGRQAARHVRLDGETVALSRGLKAEYNGNTEELQTLLGGLIPGYITQVAYRSKKSDPAVAVLRSHGIDVV